MAEELLGQKLDDNGRCVCPWEAKHTTGRAGQLHFRVWLDEKPRGSCFHSNCGPDVDAFNDRFFEARKAWYEARRGGHRIVPLHPAQPGVAQEPKFEPKWRLPFDYSKLREEARVDWKVDAQWFVDRSPVEVGKVDGGSYLEHAFYKGDRVLIFTEFASQGQFGHLVGRGSVRVAPRPDVKPVKSQLPRGGENGVWYLVNPVDGQWHPNPRQLDEHGRATMSRRSQESVVCQRHIIMECDHKERACPCKDCNGRDNPGINELWLNFLAQLPLPIVAVYSSGGKSWHALCRLNFTSKGELDVFKKRHGGAFSIFGADPKAWSPTQLSRLPNCMRGERLQRLIYLNPRPDPTGMPIGEGGNVICDG